MKVIWRRKVVGERWSQKGQDEMVEEKAGETKESGMETGDMEEGKGR